MIYIIGKKTKLIKNMILEKRKSPRNILSRTFKPPTMNDDDDDDNNGNNKRKRKKLMQ